MSWLSGKCSVVAQNFLYLVCFFHSQHTVKTIYNWISSASSMSSRPTWTTGLSSGSAHCMLLLWPLRGALCPPITLHVIWCHLEVIYPHITVFSPPVCLSFPFLHLSGLCQHQPTASRNNPLSRQWAAHLPPFRAWPAPCLLPLEILFLLSFSIPDGWLSRAKKSISGFTQNHGWWDWLEVANIFPCKTSQWVGFNYSHQIKPKKNFPSKISRIKYTQSEYVLKHAISSILVSNFYPNKRFVNIWLWRHLSAALLFQDDQLNNGLHVGNPQKDLMWPNRPTAFIV